MQVFGFWFGHHQRCCGRLAFRRCKARSSSTPASARSVVGEAAAGYASGNGGAFCNLVPSIDDVAARRGGGQSLATALTAMQNRITTVASTATARNCRPLGDRHVAYSDQCGRSQQRERVSGEQRALMHSASMRRARFHPTKPRVLLRYRSAVALVDQHLIRAKEAHVRRQRRCPQQLAEPPDGAHNYPRFFIKTVRNNQLLASSQP